MMANQKSRLKMLWVRGRNSYFMTKQVQQEGAVCPLSTPTARGPSVEGARRILVSLFLFAGSSYDASLQRRAGWSNTSQESKVTIGFVCWIA